MNCSELIAGTAAMSSCTRGFQTASERRIRSQKDVAVHCARKSWATGGVNSGVVTLGADLRAGGWVGMGVGRDTIQLGGVGLADLGERSPKLAEHTAYRKHSVSKSNQPAEPKCHTGECLSAARGGHGRGGGRGGDLW